MIKKSAFRLVSASRTALFIVMITTLSIQPCQAILIETLPAYPIVDKDLVSRGNLVWLHQRGLTYDYQAVTTGEQTYRLGKFSRIEQSIATPTYLVLHDSENAAFDSGLQMVATQGGTLWVLENTENRNLYDYASQRLTHSDPNRMFWGLDNASSSLNQHSDSQNAHLQATAEQADKDTLKEPVKTNANAEFAKKRVHPAAHVRHTALLSTKAAERLVKQYRKHTAVERIRQHQLAVMHQPNKFIRRGHIVRQILRLIHPFAI